MANHNFHPFLAWAEACFPHLSSPKLRKGSHWVEASCPLHSDSKPSLGINIDHGAFFCHSCQEKGNLYRLAELAGLSTDLLPERGSKEQDGESSTSSYVYFDLENQPLLRVKRVEAPGKAKKIFQEHWEGARWVPGSPEEVSFFNLRAVMEAELHQPIFFVEGEKKAQHGIDRGLLCCCAPGGAGKSGRVHSRYWDVFAGRIVYILPDEDEPGLKHSVEVAAFLQDVGARVKIVRLPGLPRKGDLVDWLILPRRAEDVLAICDAANWLEPVSALPSIFFGENWNLVEHVNAAMKALKRWNSPPRIFLQGDQMVRLKKNGQGQSVPDSLTEQALYLCCAEAAKWIRVTRTETKAGSVERHQETYPNKDVVRSLLHHSNPPIPTLVRIVRSPVFVGDGRLLSTAGFDPGAGVLYEPDPCFERLKVPIRPTSGQIEAAKSLLAHDLLGDYPWQDESSLAHAFSMILTPFIRDLYKLVPFWFVNATVARSGKSKLVKCVALMHTGEQATTLTWISSEEELRKRLTSVLKNLPAILQLDNVPRKLDSATLAAMATMDTWEDRELSRTLALKIPMRNIVVGTGNNTQFSAELCKRIVPIRLAHQCDRPELRTDFKIPDLEDWTLKNRRQLVEAGLTLVSHWVAEGRPQNKLTRIGGFERWSQDMGGLLDSIGLPGFMQNIDEVSGEADEETLRLELLIDAWREAFGQNEVTATEMHGRFENHESEHLQSLFRGESKRAQVSSLGCFLRRAKGRIVRGQTVCQRILKGVSLYRLSSNAKEAPPIREEPPKDVIGDLI